MTSKRVLLIIMDGWGLGNGTHSDAIANAKVPFYQHLRAQYGQAELLTCGEDVGLPEGQMGNSEVGHLNIGAGRVVYQELVRINRAIRSGELENNAALQASFAHCKQHGSRLHFLGLVSDGGVHAHINHLKALVQYAENAGLSEVFVHAFTDGRDCDPKSGAGFIGDLMDFLKDKNTQLATVTGRYYAMDRDKRWERVQKAWSVLVKGEGTPSDDILASIHQAYEAGMTDEFLLPMVNTAAGDTRIRENDAVVFFNFRTDRGRELSQVLSQVDMPDFGMHRLNLHFTTLTRYDASFHGVHVMLENDDLRETLGEIVSKAGKKQIRIAETEKYPHVTFFFSGGREEPFPGEKRILVPSPKVATYDLQPEMSAEEITDQLLPEIERRSADFICLNFANADMVGHTGVYDAICKAVETVDFCVARLATAALEADYAVLITADHGNADYAENPDGSPNTAHSLNPVPVFLLDRSKRHTLQNGRLADLAPTILALMGIEQPASMDGKNLIQA